MVNSLLFKWEDSQALKHHCGFCERPLSHPGARASCFGKHSEPCVRFHQAMFMRLRGHTCTYCQSIDEVHYKRHHDIAEQLRAVYESCDEVDWTIIPVEPEVEERGRAREPGDSSSCNDEIDRSLTPEDTPSSKRERKDAKRLARAASRSRVITQEEIRYIDSVVHSFEGISSNDNDGPRNPEEVEEIEKQLRYHAHVYNTQGNRRGLKKLAEDPAETDVDFNAEMDRILETFRITELLKRNTKTKGLMGKELKTFLSLVDDIKQAVIEDIVQVKKDAAEVRMRRAGYLRYTNMTSYRIVEDRYTTKDWKTGEKFQPSGSDTSDVLTPTEELASPISTRQENQSPQPRRNTHGPDMRHLETTHKRINGDDGLHRNILEPYDAPLLPAPPLFPAKAGQTPSKRAAVLIIKASDRSPAVVRGGRRNTPQQTPDGWSTITNGAVPTTSVAKPRVWGNVPDTRVTDGPQSGFRPSPFVATQFPDLSSASRRSSDDAKAPAVQAPSAWAAKEPESFVAETEEPANGHPVVSQKKKSKKAREVKRKARKLGLSVELADDPVDEHEATEEAKEEVDVVSDRASTPAEAKADIVKQDEQHPSRSGDANTDGVATEVVEPVVVMPEAFAPAPASMAITKSGKHMHWTRFMRNFVADQLTDPFLPSWSGCSHGTSCAFETNDVRDCPFHEPHCPCVDPVADQCYLVLPCGELCSSGPYNRLRGQKLLSLYEKDPRTKGRIMLVDDDLIHYFMEDPSSRALKGCGLGIPDRLAKEYADFAEGYNPGPLMEQERRFERLWSRNKIVKHELTQGLLQEIQRSQFERPGTRYMCYCRAAVPKGGAPAKNTVICSYVDCNTRYFHKSCVKKLGVEKVSRWYCTSCEYQMKAVARQTLRDLGFTDIPVERFADMSMDEDSLEELFDEKLEQLLDMSEDQYEKLLPPGLTKKIKEFGGMQGMPEEYKEQLRQKARSLGVRAKGVSVRAKGVSVMAFDVPL